jgi:hypothetical protein
MGERWENGIFFIGPLQFLLVLKNLFPTIRLERKHEAEMQIFNFCIE